MDRAAATMRTGDGPSQILGFLRRMADEREVPTNSRLSRRAGRSVSGSDMPKREITQAGLTRPTGKTGTRAQSWCARVVHPPCISRGGEQFHRGNSQGPQGRVLPRALTTRRRRIRHSSDSAPSRLNAPRGEMGSRGVPRARIASQWLPHGGASVPAGNPKPREPGKTLIDRRETGSAIRRTSTPTPARSGQRLPLEAEMGRPVPLRDAPTSGQALPGLALPGSALPPQGERCTH